LWWASGDGAAENQAGGRPVNRIHPVGTKVPFPPGDTGMARQLHSPAEVVEKFLRVFDASAGKANLRHVIDIENATVFELHVHGKLIAVVANPVARDTNQRSKAAAKNCGTADARRWPGRRDWPVAGSDGVVLHSLKPHRASACSRKVTLLALVVLFVGAGLATLADDDVSFVLPHRSRSLFRWPSRDGLMQERSDRCWAPPWHAAPNNHAVSSGSNG
jgi:hypothetical protein